MNPRLIAISGTLKGTIFDLVEDEILIGREPSNPMCLNDLSVSRRHCLIKRERAQTQNKMSEAKPQVGDVDTESGQPERDGQAATLGAITAGPANREDVIADSQFTISDLESFNGTFVNGVPVKEQALAHGDQIAVGDVVLLFLLHETDAGAKAAIQSDEGDLITRSTVRLRREDSLYLRPDRILAELPATARVARDLNTLLKISNTANSIRGLSQLQRELLKLALEVIPAEREAILLVDGGQEVFGSVCGWSKLVGLDDS